MPSPRVTVRREPGRTVVRIAAPRSWTMIVFLLFWMVGWAGGEAATLRALASGEIRASAYGFVGAWLVLWTLGGVAGVVGLLWAFAGHDLVTAGGGQLALRRAAGPLGRTQVFPLAEIDGLRYVPPTAGDRRTRAAPGRLAFRHGERTVNFGVYVGAEDARAALEALAPAVPGAAPARR
jgi:hypothetical protein